MKENILAYLEAFGQPQSLEAIRDNVDPVGDRTALRQTLDEMVKVKQIRRVEDGVDHRGEPMIFYAPRSY